MEVPRKIQLNMAIVSGVALFILLLYIFFWHKSPSLAVDTPTTQTKERLPVNIEKESVPQVQPPQVTDKQYTYIAVFGDSYTGLVRDALAQYIAQHNLTLTHEEIQRVENMLINNAGAPMLDVGQEVIVRSNAIVEAIDSVRG